MFVVSVSGSANTVNKLIDISVSLTVGTNFPRWVYQETGGSFGSVGRSVAISAVTFCLKFTFHIVLLMLYCNHVSCRQCSSRREKGTGTQGSWRAGASL